MKIILVVGARPNFMKIAPMVWEFKKKGFRGFQVVHTGQHYDYKMSKVFFEELELHEPDYFLNIGSGTHAEQTARVMIEFEKVCMKEKPDITVVVGDVNSTLACSLVAKKLNGNVAHVEAGLRSRDMTMPEEINRIVTDSISDSLFVSEKSGVENLRKEGNRDDQIFFVGNIMIDTLFYQIKKIGVKKNASAGKYGVVTLHRPSNVDERNVLGDILASLVKISKDIPLVFPVHPRTRTTIEAFGLMSILNGSHIQLLSPLSYLDFLKLWKDAAVVFTDSGGLQEETTALGIPCFTIRENTERPITVEEGTNTLVGTRKEDILDAFVNFMQSNSKRGKIPIFWDGRTAERIAEILLNKHMSRENH